MILSGPSLLFVLVPQLVEVVFFSIVIQNFKRCSQQNHTFTYLINNNKMNVINNYKKILAFYIQAVRTNPSVPQGEVSSL